MLKLLSDAISAASVSSDTRGGASGSLPDDVTERFVGRMSLPLVLFCFQLKLNNQIFRAKIDIKT